MKHLSPKDTRVLWVGVTAGSGGPLMWRCSLVSERRFTIEEHGKELGIVFPSSFQMTSFLFRCFLMEFIS